MLKRNKEEGGKKRGKVLKRKKKTTVMRSNFNSIHRLYRLSSCVFYSCVRCLLWTHCMIDREHQCSGISFLHLYAKVLSGSLD